VNGRNLQRALGGDVDDLVVQLGDVTALEVVPVAAGSSDEHA
jgi:hypothetical protein